MKKTLFLSAILGAALCSSAFAEYSWKAQGDTIVPANNGTAITYGAAIPLTSTDPVSGDVKTTDTGIFSANLSTANSLYISSGRLRVNGSNLSKLGNEPIFIKGGQLWVNTNATLTNDLYLGTSTYGGSENGDKAALRLQSGGTITLSGTITLGEDARINVTGANTTANITGNISGEGKALSLTAFHQDTCRFNLSGTNRLGTLDIAETTIGSSAVTANVTIAGGTTTTDRLTLGLANAATLTVAAGAKLTVNNSAALAKTITNNGTLNLSGNVEISGLTPTTSEVYYGDTADHSTLNGNGYAIRGTRTYQLITNNGTLNTETATFSDDIMSGGTCGETGLVTLTKTSGTASGVYYVNTGELDYTVTSAAASSATTAIKVTNSGATITIASDASLAASKLNAQATTKLSGSGLYVAGSAQTLGTNVSLADDWTGTVQLKGELNTNANFFTTAAKNGSTIEMKGVTKWTSDWNTKQDGKSPISQNIKLTNDGNNAAWVYGAYYTDNSEKYESANTTFSGNWSGNGNFMTNIDNPQMKGMRYIYTGDISQWTGIFKVNTNNANSVGIVEFGGNATMVNATLQRDSGIMKVVADADVTFSQNITGAALLTINDGKKVTIQQGLTIGAIQMGTGSSLTFSANKLLEVDGASALSNLTVQDLQFKQFTAETTAADVAYTVSLSGTNTVGGTLDMARGSNNQFAAATMLITAGSALTHNGSYLRMKHTNDGILLEKDAIFNRNVHATDIQYTVKGLSSAEGQRGQILWTPESGDGALTNLDNANVSISNAELTMKYSGTISTTLSNVVLKTGNYATTVNTDAVLTGLEIGSALTINSGKIVTLNGTANYTGTTSTREVALTSGNGYGTVETYAQVIIGEGTLTGTTTWTYNGQATTSYNNGELITASTASSIYYVNDATASIDVVAGDKFQIKTASDITVNSGTLDYANITAGQNNIKSVTLAGEASLVKGIFTLTGDGASITPVAGQAFDIAQTGSTVSNGDVAITVGDHSITFFNKLEDVNLTYTNTVVQNQTLQLNNENTLGNVTMNSGATLEIVGGSTAISGTATLNGVIVDSNASLTFSETEQTIGALTLHAGANVTLGTADKHNAALNITSLTVTGTGASVNADLVVNGGSLTFANGSILTMGCDVKLGTEDTVTVVLTDAMVQSIAQGGHVVLFDGVESATLGDHITFSGNLLNPTNAYALVYDETAKTIYVTPEPATATLSLLALAALAARRKRH